VKDGLRALHPVLCFFAGLSIRPTAHPHKNKQMVFHRKFLEKMKAY
jgi:hypothetical protein